MLQHSKTFSAVVCFQFNGDSLGKDLLISGINVHVYEASSINEWDERGVEELT